MNKRIIHNNLLTVRDNKKCLKQNVLRYMQRTYSKNFSLIGALFLSSALKGFKVKALTFETSNVRQSLECLLIDM
jgi:hypothetical protein